MIRKIIRVLQWWLAAIEERRCRDRFLPQYYDGIRCDRYDGHPGFHRAENGEKW